MMTKTHKIIINARLPGLNDFYNLAKGRKGMYMANNKKQEVEEMIAYTALNQVKDRPIKSPVAIEYHWVEPNKRRDLDNIAFAKKFINDALVKIGILEGDGWRDIKALKDTFAFESRNPRVEILIRELEVEE